MIKNSKRTGAAVEAHYQFLMWLVPAVEKFPRSHKFTTGDPIHTLALDVLEGLIEATYTKERLQHGGAPGNCLVGLDRGFSYQRRAVGSLSLSPTNR
jgi:hypothetical protein